MNLLHFYKPFYTKLIKLIVSHIWNVNNELKFWKNARDLKENDLIWKDNSEHFFAWQFQDRHLKSQLKIGEKISTWKKKYKSWNKQKKLWKYTIIIPLSFFWSFFNSEQLFCNQIYIMFIACNFLFV